VLAVMNGALEGAHARTAHGPGVGDYFRAMSAMRMMLIHNTGKAERYQAWQNSVNQT